MVVHAYNPNTQGLRQEDCHEFESHLDYTARSCIKKERRKEMEEDGRERRREERKEG